jgi:hypothetical protein
MYGQSAAAIPVYPVLGTGHALTPDAAVEMWLQVGWLMLAEGRAYIEDLEGAEEQPQTQQAVKLRLLEQLSDIDQRLAGRIPAADAHCLALALEYGVHSLMEASGEKLVEVFGLEEEFGGEDSATGAVMQLWERLVDGFPGELPDRLVAQGQRDMLVTFRGWARLGRSVGLDVALLTRFIKEA